MPAISPIIDTTSSPSYLSESPWEINRIVSHGALLMERNSSNEEKRKLAAETALEINDLIVGLKASYNKAVAASEEGGTAPLAIKISQDISFCDNMRDFINAQANGLVSKQKSWKIRAAQTDARYKEELGLSGWWLKLKKQLPWIDSATGLVAGAAVWAVNGWDAIIKLAQVGAEAIVKSIDPQSDLQRQLGPVIELIINLTGAFALAKITSGMDKRGFDRKQRLLDECEMKQKRIMEEEQLERRKIIGLIKNKAVYLSALHGYSEELRKVAPEISELLVQNDYAAIKKMHDDYVRKIVGDGTPGHLLEGAENDSNSTDLYARNSVAAASD